MNVNTQHGGAVLLAKTSALVFGAPATTASQLVGALVLMIFVAVAALALSEPIWRHRLPRGGE